MTPKMLSMGIMLMGIVHVADKVAEYHFVRKPYVLTIAILTIAEILAASFMPHNPFAWGIFALTMGLMLTTVTNSD